MLTIQPTGQTLGATITGIDLKQALSKADFAALLRALADHGVLRFPNQLLNPRELKLFSERFGKPQILGQSKFFDAEFPEVTILSNIIENGKPLGVADAGQTWHTDMAYSRTIGFVNVLVAYAVPMRDGQPLGATAFTNTQAAYQDLPDDIKKRLDGAYATHDVVKYREYLEREKNKPRSPLTPEQRAKLPPVSHPLFLTHPLSGKKVIYVTPTFTVKIDGLPADESDAWLKLLIDHVLKPKYRYVNHWAVGDLLMWDHIGTWHNAVADYGPNEHRLIKRCQVMADRVFDPAFVRQALAA
jgi:taurine dioxygenase